MFTWVHHHFLLNTIELYVESLSLSFFFSFLDYPIDKSAYRPSINLIRQRCFWYKRRMVCYYCFVKNTSYNSGRVDKSLFFSLFSFSFLSRTFFFLSSVLLLMLLLFLRPLHTLSPSRPPFLFLCSFFSFSLSIDAYFQHGILYYGRC